MRTEQEIKARIKELEDDNKRFMKAHGCGEAIIAFGAIVRNEALIRVLKWILNEQCQSTVSLPS